MRTPRRHRLTRRQSEQLLDGLGGPGDLSRLLADARPLRVDGELPGEAAAAAAFRGAAPALDPQPRSSSVTTLSLSRALLVKVVAVASASFAVGGVALAATTHHLPGQSPRTPSASPSAAPHPTKSDGKDDKDDKDGTSGKGDPSHRPSGSPSTSTSGRPEDLHGIGLCRAWDEVSRNTGANSPATKAKPFLELQTKAGGAAKVASYCDSLVTAWCESHHWPGAEPVQIEGNTTVMRCVRPGDTPGAAPSVAPSGVPSVVPSGTPSLLPNGKVPPSHPGKSGGAPSGGPAHS
ncbi:MAG TPA: hypothetical protein VFP72_07150 [Kineosporiaceae bacterium]|nr:hypothetical protein [Kineosporiaceae bacterium]